MKTTSVNICWSPGHHAGHQAVTGWTQLTARPALSALILVQQLLHMSTMAWGWGCMYCVKVIFTWPLLYESCLYPEESQQDHIYIFNSNQINTILKQYVFREVHYSQILPLSFQSYQTPPSTYLKHKYPNVPDLPIYIPSSASPLPRSPLSCPIVPPGCRMWWAPICPPST